MAAASTTAQRQQLGSGGDSGRRKHCSTLGQGRRGEHGHSSGSGAKAIMNGWLHTAGSRACALSEDAMDSTKRFMHATLQK
jgi:hypothetical protein